jgi:hypothetical protein
MKEIYVDWTHLIQWQANVKCVINFSIQWKTGNLLQTERL